MFRVITHPNLLAMIESLVGPEIIGSSVYRIRPKVPGVGQTVVPWHQDSGYIAAQVTDYETFAKRRIAYENARQIPVPTRGWQPVPVA